MPVIDLAIKLVAGQANLFGVDDYHEITCIHVVGENRLVFTPKDMSSLSRKAAEDLVTHEAFSRQPAAAGGKESNRALLGRAAVEADDFTVASEGQLAELREESESLRTDLEGKQAELGTEGGTASGRRLAERAWSPPRVNFDARSSAGAGPPRGTVARGTLLRSTRTPEAYPRPLTGTTGLQVLGQQRD